MGWPGHTQPLGLQRSGAVPGQELLSALSVLGFCLPKDGQLPEQSPRVWLSTDELLPPEGGQRWQRPSPEPSALRGQGSSDR